MYHGSREKTIDFLRKGFRDNNISYKEEDLHEVYEELSGIPGFISYYGLLKIRGLEHQEALSRTENYAILQWENDLEALLRIHNSPLYLHILSILSKTVTGASWSELHYELEKRLTGSVGKSTLHRIPTNLLKAGMIQKRREKYMIVDHPLRKTINKLEKNTVSPPILNE